MWAQLMKVRSPPEREAEMLAAFDQLQAIEQPDSGLVRTTVMRSQADPGVAYVLVVFASEESARAREADPRRQEGLQHIRASLGAAMEGAPEFTDLDVVRET